MASVVAQNAIYASAPLTLLAALGILNRSRLERQLEHAEAQLSDRTDRLSNKLTSVAKQISAMPSPEAVANSQRLVMERTDRALVSFSRDIRTIKREMGQRLDGLQIPDLAPVSQEIMRLKEQGESLQTSLDHVNSQVNRLSSLPRLQDAENQLAQLKTEIMQLRVNVEATTGESRAAIAHLNDSVNHVERGLKQLPVMLDPRLIREEMQHLVNTVTELVPQRDFNNLATRLQELHQRQSELRRSVDALRQSQTDSFPSDQTATQQAVQQQIAYPNQRLETLPGISAQNRQMIAAGPSIPVSPQPQTPIHAASPGATSQGMSQWIVDFPRVAGEHESASRKALKAALDRAQERVLLVWPWALDLELDDDLIRKFHQLLERGCQLEIGWCHRDQARQGRLLRSIHQRWQLAPEHLKPLRAALNRLLPLRRAYAQRFRFKILGTDEGFLVCDRTFAILSLQELPAQSTVFPELGLKLQVEDPAIIEALISRFDNPDLTPEDARAYFNRATTRCDLRDYQGAIDDYSQVLAHLPDHAIALNNRGVAYAELGRSADAEADFSQAIATGVDLYAAYCNRGWLRLDQERFPAAIQDFTGAIQSNSDCPIPYVYRGNAFQQLGDFNAAITDYNRAIACSYGSPIPYIYRSAAHQQRGNLQQAVTDLELAQQCLSAHGDSQVQLTVTRTLQKLRQLVRPQNSVSIMAPSTHP
ncbi:hypothetical protein C7271_02605 [filamentous cyanobacterium CCP5]|nr:hypothetical protein C7271_02605 [filamentous cyanobacterium CCP5]